MRVDLELGYPCMRTWTPRTCRGWGQRSPVDHRCMVPLAFPHVCVCATCSPDPWADQPWARPAPGEPIDGGCE